jgi:hypothetical protein
MHQKIINSNIHKLIILCIITHIISVFNTGNFWDGGQMQYHMVYNQDYFKEITLQLGQPQIFYFFHLIHNILPFPIITYHIITILSIIVIAISTNTICIKGLNLNKTHAFFAAAIAATIPFYHIFISTIFIHYHICIALFFSGFAILINGKNTIPIQALILLSIAFACYTINSLLVLYFGYLMIYWYSIEKFKLPNKEKLFPSLYLFLRNHPILCILPFVIFITKNHFHQPYGIYANYNELLFSRDIPFSEMVSLFFHAFPLCQDSCHH